MDSVVAGRDISFTVQTDNGDWIGGSETVNVTISPVSTTPFDPGSPTAYDGWAGGDVTPGEL